jgi:hypothetical protein
VGGTSSIHPEQINAVSERFSAVGQELAEVIKRDTERLADVGDAWGNDEAGEQFARLYIPAAQLAIQALSTLAISIPRIGVDLCQMGRESSLNESNIAAQLGASLSASGVGPGLTVDGGSRLLNVAAGVSTRSSTDLVMNPSLYGPLVDAAGDSNDVSVSGLR